jgi:fructose-bisphosphate aldolase class I
VEPEVLIDGDHDIDTCYAVTEETLHTTFHAIHEHRVELSGMLLKPNMVISGKDAPEQAGVEEVADATVACLLATVPAAVPGIVFLSGGQSDRQATAHLNAMNARYENLPWEISFSYARALQDLPMKTWKGEAENAEAAQRAFHHRGKMNSAARSGTYAEEMESEAS